MKKAVANCNWGKLKIKGRVVMMINLHLFDDAGDVSKHPVSILVLLRLGFQCHVTFLNRCKQRYYLANSISINKMTKSSD